MPLVSLLRAAGALHRLPPDLPLDVIIDSGMRYVLNTAEGHGGFASFPGALAAGNDVGMLNLTTMAEAEAHCEALARVLPSLDPQTCGGSPSALPCLVAQLIQTSVGQDASPQSAKASRTKASRMRVAPWPASSSSRRQHT